MRKDMWLFLGALGVITGVLSIKQYVADSRRDVLYEESRKDRLRKMNLGGQIVTEEELNNTNT